MRVALIVLLICSVAFAGCATKDTAQPGDSTDFSGLNLQATQDTGVIRGVVIDEAIRPLANATVELRSTDTSIVKTTGADGLFGFASLAPGTYFLIVTRLGYLPTQTSVEVRAGVSDPAPVKVQLILDAQQLPYHQQYVMEGFMTCSARIALTAVPAGPCMSTDVSQTTYQLDAVPTWGQSEMQWKSTQALGDAMSLVSECFSGTAKAPDPCPRGNLVINRSEGSSPLIIKFNETLLTEYRVGDVEGNPYRLRIFAAGRADTDLIDEDAHNKQLNQTTGGVVKCIAWPAINEGCFRITGIGVILNQGFKVYSTVFYGYAPPADWNFIQDSKIPAPPK